MEDRAVYSIQRAERGQGIRQKDIQGFATRMGLKVKFGGSAYIGHYSATFLTPAGKVVTDKRKMKKIENYIW
jgi:hypothetical protein